RTEDRRLPVLDPRRGRPSPGAVKPRERVGDASVLALRLIQALAGALGFEPGGRLLRLPQPEQGAVLRAPGPGFSLRAGLAGLVEVDRLGHWRNFPRPPGFPKPQPLRRRDDDPDFPDPRAYGRGGLRRRARRPRRQGDGRRDRADQARYLLGP